MWRRPLLPLAAIAALALSAAAQAQDAPASPAAPAAPSHRSYSPDQMNSFARATVELQNLGTQDPEAMSRTIQGSGMSVEDYNQMGDAMRADPALATSLNPYLDSANSARAARIYAQRSQTPSFAEPRHASSHRAVASHASSHKASSRHSRSSTHKASHTRTTKHGHTTKASHKATAARHTGKKTTTHTSSSAHKSKRHRRS
jgi:glucose/arabinose dehydrogenase